MAEVSTRFRELSEQLGGFNERALESLIAFKNPFELYHWTMNVIEILLIAGAAWGLFHAIHTYRTQNKVMNLGVWLASVTFMLAVEIPVYFPEKLGLDPNSIMFLHNEFSIQFFFDRAPLYIMALYPALMYTSYALVERTGIFQKPHGLVLGAFSVGFVHHVFYEIFDHFGPQYGWWIWNYPQFISNLASVPVSSMTGFALLGPVSLTLMTGLVLGRHASRREAMKLTVTRAQFIGRTLIAGVLTPIGLAILTPQTYLSMMGDVSAAAEMTTCFALIAIVGITTVYQFSKNAEPAEQEGSESIKRYFSAYLLVFAALWLYALPEYFSAENGVTHRGTPIGSLSYTLGCFVFALYFTFGAGLLKRVSSSHAAVLKAN